MNSIIQSPRVAAAILFTYLFIRICGDPWWRTITPWAAYAFEILFVFVAISIYRTRAVLKAHFNFTVPATFVSLALGFSIHRLILTAGLQVPFDFNDSEILFLLLL